MEVTMRKFQQVFIPYIVGLLGGYIFYLFHFPIPWILGPMFLLIMWKNFAPLHGTYNQPTYLKNVSFIILGITFGLSFTADTFRLIGPYAIPFLFFTILLICLSIINGLFISKFVNIDKATSIFASVPGGLTEMVIASESVQANTSLVTIFQTVRLLTVVFLVPFSVLHLLDGHETPSLMLETSFNAPFLSYAWFILAGFVGYIVRAKLPAAYVIGPLLTIALLNILGVPLPQFHPGFIIFAQLSIGVSFGLMISIRDLITGGKYCLLYFLTTMILIISSFGVGYLFSVFTDINLATAILSFAPGGLVEMVLTATSVGADPSVVSALQFIRLLFIITIVPSVLTFLLKPAIDQKLNTS